MNSYLIQILTKEQRTTLLQLMVALEMIEIGKNASWRVRTLTGGVVSWSKYKALKNWREKIGGKFNHALFELQETRCKFDACSFMASIKAELLLAPTSKLWCRLVNWNALATTSGRDTYMTFKSQEEVVRFHKIKQHPSLLKILISFSFSSKDKKSSREKLLTDWLSAIIQQLQELKPYGVCDQIVPIKIPNSRQPIIVPDMYDLFENNNPSTYDHLEGQFKLNDHYLIFGPKNIVEDCEKFDRSIALGEGFCLKISSC